MTDYYRPYPFFNNDHAEYYTGKHLLGLNARMDEILVEMGSDIDHPDRYQHVKTARDRLNNECRAAADREFPDLAEDSGV